MLVKGVETKGESKTGFARLENAARFSARLQLYLTNILDVWRLFALQYQRVYHSR